MWEMFQLSFMVNAFLACLILGLLLSYLGIHVVGRGIVFVDLALGQISSLGVAIAEFLHFGEEWLPVLFTLVGALLLSLIHIRDKRLKLEAVIGIIYVVAAAVTVLVISKTPHGEADIQEVLFGALLAVTDTELVHLGVIFGVLVILHAVFYKQVFRITEQLRRGEAVSFTLRDRLWNFFFYLSIGLAIVFAVRIGGVLPVFSYLVIPAVSALMMTRRDLMASILAVIIAGLAGYGGLWFAYTYDFPAGPSIVAIFGVLFILAVLVRAVRTEVEP